jgi:hypothetical protein
MHLHVLFRTGRVPKSELHLTRKTQLSKKCISISFLKTVRVPEPRQYLRWIIPVIPLCVTSGCGCGYKLNAMKHKGRKLPAVQEENRSWLF